MNRHTLDVALPILFGLVVALTAILTEGTAVAVVAVVGGLLLAAYFAVVRRMAE